MTIYTSSMKHSLSVINTFDRGCNEICPTAPIITLYIHSPHKWWGNVLILCKFLITTHTHTLNIYAQAHHIFRWYTTHSRTDKRVLHEIPIRKTCHMNICTYPDKYAILEQWTKLISHNTTIQNLQLNLEYETAVAAAALAAVVTVCCHLSTCCMYNIQWDITTMCGGISKHSWWSFLLRPRLAVE